MEKDEPVSYYDVTEGIASPETQNNMLTISDASLDTSKG